MHHDTIHFGFGLSGQLQRQKFLEEFQQACRHGLCEDVEVKIEEIYDDIKGYQCELHVDDQEEENLNVWLIAFGWSHVSSHLTSIIKWAVGEGHAHVQEQWNTLLVKAKQAYPEKFR